MFGGHYLMYDFLLSGVLGHYSQTFSFKFGVRSTTFKNIRTVHLGNKLHTRLRLVLKLFPWCTVLGH